MSETPNYKYLEPRPDKRYKQWYVKGRKIRAIVLASRTVGEGANTPEEVAEDYDLPVEAVLEAIDYCNRFPDVLQRDWEMEEESIRAREAIHPQPMPPKHPPTA